MVYLRCDGSDTRDHREIIGTRERRGAFARMLI